MLAISRLAVPAAAALVFVSLAHAEDQLNFGPPSVLSQEASEVAGGADPGGSASKVKLLGLTKTPNGVHDGRLVVVYADANHDVPIWHPRDRVHLPRDIFARYSDDDGQTWSDPVNLSQSADKYSRSTDWDGDGFAEPYYGGCAKPNVFSNGDTVVVSWVGRYAPEEGWTWGQSGESSVQGTALYPDLEVYPNQREIPFAATWLAVSKDGGASWLYGGSNPPLQLTYGRRDAIQDVHRGSGKRWVVTWQEDPAGLQTGEADGPGEGASGAKVTKGTDIWYAFTNDITTDALALRTSRTPLSNHSRYDLGSTNGYPLVGQAGSVQNHGASRANTFLLNDGGVFRALVAYEETKGIPDIVEGKRVHYHAFPFDAPPSDGDATARTGVDGAVLTDEIENGRRVRFVAQPPQPGAPAIAIFWRQGLDTEGAPADILLKVSPSVEEADVLAAQTLNISTNAPQATPEDLMLPPGADGLEDARAHRGLMNGQMLVLGFSYTWNGPLARYTDLANYNFYIRRSLDGGLTWLAPQNVSSIEDTKVNVLEPRLVGPPKTETADEATFVVAWGTEKNVYEGLEPSEPLDSYITRTTDQGATFAKVVPMLVTAEPEFESQIRVNDDCSQVFAAIQRETAPIVDAVFLAGVTVEVPESVGRLYCFGNGTGLPCPCGNDSDAATGQGCANSTGLGGLLVGAGSASVLADDLLLAASQLPAGQPALAFLGLNEVDGGLGAPFGAGLRCAGGGVLRLGAKVTDAEGAQGWGPGLALAFGLQPGDARYAQVYYRDPAAGGCGESFNTTNGLALDFEP